MKARFWMVDGQKNEKNKPVKLQTFSVRAGIFTACSFSGHFLTTFSAYEGQRPRTLHVFSHSTSSLMLVMS